MSYTHSRNDLDIPHLSYPIPFEFEIFGELSIDEKAFLSYAALMNISLLSITKVSAAMEEFLKGYLGNATCD